MYFLTQVISIKILYIEYKYHLFCFYIEEGVLPDR